MKKRNRTMRKIATFIVDKRLIIMLLFAALLVGSVFTAGLTKVDNDLYHFLPEETETRRALDAMGSEFYTYATAQVMVENVSVEEAYNIKSKLLDGKGIKSVEFEFDEEHFRGNAALYNVTFKGELSDSISKAGVKHVKSVLEDYASAYVATDVGLDYSKTIIKNMSIVGSIVVVIVIAMLFLTSHSYAEVPVLLITFAVAALLQLGTNFIFPSISYISNAVTLILQLALAIDYAIILCNRYAEERRRRDHRPAMIVALSKAIPEISGSSLTTIGGLVAMSFIQFGLGKDMAMVLIKSILISMLTVFLLMPGLMMMFANAIDRSRHRNFVPKLPRLGNFAWRTRKVIPAVFLVLIIAACYFSTNLGYYYDYETLYPVAKTESHEAEIAIHEKFGYNNMMALVVPSGAYDVEAQMLEQIAEDPHVVSTLGLATVDVAEGHRLGDKISIDEFSKLAGLDEMSATALFAFYAARNSDYNMADEALHEYEVPLVDLFLFLYDVTESGKLELSDEQVEMIEGYYDQLADAKLQLKGSTYSRMLIYSDYPVQSEESYAMIEKIHEIAESYYGGDVYVAGNTTSARDLEDSFKHDSVMNTVLSALFVIIVIIFTFRNVGLAVLLILVIQGSIWLNFSVPYFTGGDVFFLSYLIVGAIQMGANIDYAIVVSNRYITMREKKHGKRESVTAAINSALPTLLTSGSILAFAGLLIGILVPESVSSSIGIALGRGTFISLALVMLVLPQILLLGDRFIAKTSFRQRERSFNVPAKFENDFESFARTELEQSRTPAKNAQSKKQPEKKPKADKPQPKKPQTNNPQQQKKNPQGKKKKKK